MTCVDNEAAAHIDLITLAIIKNIERQQNYLKHPTDELFAEVAENSTFIQQAENALDVHSRRIIDNF